MVWLGKKDNQLVAMKQFPKNGTGQMKFDPSAYVELQMAQLIRKYGAPEGKFDSRGLQWRFACL